MISKNGFSLGNAELILRPYQSDSIERLRENIRRQIKNQILCAPTGAGKTLCALYLLLECYRKGKRAIFVVDRLSLLAQTSSLMDHYGIAHGVIQSTHWRKMPRERIQLASAQSINSRGWPLADLIVIDEAHGKNKTVEARISRRDCITIGLTATPFRKGLGKYYDAIVSVTTTNKLVAEEFLVPHRVFAASEPDMRDAPVNSFGEWTDHETSKRSMPIVGDCVAEYIKHGIGPDGVGKKFIGFACDIAHATALRDSMNAAGILSALYTCETPDVERDELLKEFRKPNSAYRGLFSVAALARGFDVTDIEVVIVARALRKSLAEHIQIIGRGFRIHPGKKEVLILDHSGNYVRFFHPTQEFFENSIHELDDGKEKLKTTAKKPERKPLKCPKCFHVFPGGEMCPACGHAMPKKASVAHISGTLMELSNAPLNGHSKDKTNWRGMDRASKNRLYAELKTICRERGYNPGWAYHKFVAIVGVAPTCSKDIPEMTVSEMVRNKIRSMDIAYAYAKKKEADDECDESRINRINATTPPKR